MESREQFEKIFCKKECKYKDTCIYSQPPISCYSDFLESKLKSANENKWISVKDKLPEFGESVLIAWGDSKGNISTGSYLHDVVRKKDINRWYWHGRLSPFSVTHWQLLPEPPK